MKGWGPESSVCPSKPRETRFWPGICRGRPKSLRKKKFVFNIWTLELVGLPTQRWGASDTGKGPIPLREMEGAKATRNGNHEV